MLILVVKRVAAIETPSFQRVSSTSSVFIDVRLTILINNHLLQYWRRGTLPTFLLETDFS